MVEEVKTQQQTTDEDAGENVVSTTFEGVNLWSKWTPEERKEKQEEILALAAAYTHFTGRTD